MEQNMNATHLDNPNELQTPLSKPALAPSPASATKIVERSLHDLDDLIQKRRLELSALRKSNRKKLSDKFDTPSINRSVNFDRKSITLSDIQTPKLNFQLREQDMLSFKTPSTDNNCAKMIQITQEEYEKLLSSQANILQNGRNDQHIESENNHTGNDHDNMIKVSNEEYEIFLNYENQLKQLRQESTAKYQELERTILTLEDDYQAATQKCRNISQEKSKLEMEIEKTENTLQLISVDYEELKLEYQKIKDDPSRVSANADADAAGSFVPKEVHTDKNNNNNNNISDTLPEENLKAMYQQCLDDKAVLQSEVETLRAQCEEWEANTKVAAQSAFEWEAHSTAVTSHFEAMMAEWQDANELLTDENDKLRQVLAEYEAADMINPAGSIDIIAHTDPIDVDTAVAATATATVISKQSAQATDKMNKTQIDKLSSLFQLYSMKITKREQELAMTRALDVLKFNAYFTRSKELYQTKMAEYLKVKHDELKTTFTEALSVVEEELKSSTDNSSSRQQCDLMTEQEAKAMRAKFLESESTRLMAPRADDNDSARLNQSILMSCFLLFFWMAMLYTFHAILTQLPGRMARGETLLDLVFPEHASLLLHSQQQQQSHTQSQYTNGIVKEAVRNVVRSAVSSVFSSGSGVDDAYADATAAGMGLSSGHAGAGSDIASDIGIIYNDYTYHAAAMNNEEL